MIRLVLETSAPVTVDQFITAKPNWRIVLTMRGVNADKLKIAASPDTTVVKAMSVVKSTQDTVHVMLELPAELNENQYKVFTLRPIRRQRDRFGSLLILKNRFR